MAGGKMILAFKGRGRRGRPLGSKNKPKISLTKKVTVTTPSQVRKIAKKVLLKKTEQKYLDRDLGKTELNHNAYLTNSYKVILSDQAALPTQGDSDNNRDGNKIYVSGISVPMMLYTKADNPNTKFRVIAFKYNQGYNPFGTYEALFDNISGNVMLDKVNPDTVKIIFDKVIANGKYVSSTNTDEITLFRKFWIPVKKTFTFRADNSNQFNSPGYHYGLVVVAYDTYGTVTNGVTVGAVQLWQRLYYKDL